MVSHLDITEAHTFDTACEVIANHIEKVRLEILCTDSTDADPEAEAFFLAGHAALDTAQRMFKLALYRQRKALAEGRR